MNFFDALTIVFPFAVAGKSLAKPEIVEGFENSQPPYTDEEIAEAFKAVEEKVLQHAMENKKRRRK